MWLPPDTEHLPRLRVQMRMTHRAEARPFVRLVALATLVFLCIATPAFAQGGRRGGFGRGGAMGPSRAPNLTIPKPINMINLLIAQRQDLALSDSQFAHVISIKRSLDSTNAPQMRKLDSIEHIFKGGQPIFSQPSAAHRDSLFEARGAIHDAVAAIESNNADARDHAYALLSEPQLTKAKAIEAKAEAAKAAEEAQSSRPQRGDR